MIVHERKKQRPDERTAVRAVLAVTATDVADDEISREEEEEEEEAETKAELATALEHCSMVGEAVNWMRSRRCQQTVIEYR